jgi:Flp pilus assembly protein TadG
MTALKLSSKPRRTIRLSGESGQSLAEFALVLPILLLVIFGIFEFGRAYVYWADANHIANEGARWAAVNRIPPSNTTPSDSDIQGYLSGQLDSLGFPTNRTYQICSSVATPDVGDPVTVSVSTPFSFPLVSGMVNALHTIFPVFSASSISSVTIKGTSTMRLEVTPTYAISSPC